MKKNRTFIVSLFAFFFACGLTSICFVVCGASLALFLAGFFFLTPLLPPLVLMQKQSISRVFVAACVGDGIGIVWLLAVFSPQVSFLQWVKCYVVLIAYATIPSGLAITLVRARISPLFASALSVVLWLLWLTWPVWLSTHLSDAGASRLISIHPLFAINGVLAHLGTWSHFPLAYRELTILGQDIPYSLPTTVWPSVLAHLIPGIALWWAGSWRVAAARLSAIDQSSAVEQS